MLSLRAADFVSFEIQTMMNIFKPSPSINYNFISLIYALFSVLGGLLYALEKSVFGPHKAPTDVAAGEGDENSIMKELAESTEGLYLIFVPFLPCLLWSLVVRKEYFRLQYDKAKSKSNEAVDKKKEEWRELIVLKVYGKF